MHTFKLKILTPDEKLFEGEVLSFVVPTQSGEITVLANHTPLVTNISIGEIKIKHTGPTGVEEQKFLIQGGVVDIKQSTLTLGGQGFEVVVLADQIVDAEKLGDLDVEIARAKEAMQMKADEIDFAMEESIIERNLFLKRLRGK
jgi:F-type H+-transporting ATPase subunit epsilon